VSTSIDDKRDALSRGMESAASTIRDKAESLPGGEKIAGAASRTADTMESAADYVRDSDLEDMFADVKRILKEHPGAALVAVAAAGFLLARALSRN
jgi:hypothetical protein